MSARASTLRLKRLCDVAAAVAGLVVLAPVSLCIALAVALDDGLPVLYKARRSGRDGAEFTMYKFRTMRRDDGSGPRITAQGDARVTRVGRLLRAYRLDELPQLWNVLRGEMSLVGPRPEDPLYVEHYSPAQRAVLAVRPGITGAAQIAFRDEARLLRPGHVHDDYLNVVLPAKLAIDGEYVAALSLRRDGALVAATLRALFPGKVQSAVSSALHR